LWLIFWIFCGLLRIHNSIIWSFCPKKCEKVRSHFAHPKISHTHAHRTHSFKPFPHALPHAHRTCGSAIIRTCAPQPNIWVYLGSRYLDPYSIIFRPTSTIMCHLSSYQSHWEFCPKFLSNWLNQFMLHFKKVGIPTKNC
jgi:hypothetical protein